MISNKSNVPIALAVWAVDDDYDYVNNPDYISATQLIKPIKQIILGQRVKNEDTDVEDYIAAALGSSIHAGIEKAWKSNYKANLRALGYPESIINDVIINPTVPLQKGDFPIYIEQRSTKKINGMVVGGKYDFVIDGVVQDNKSTSVYTYLHGSRDEDYQLQGSIYRWLNPGVITESYMQINYIFTDWQKAQTYSNPDYPKTRLHQKKLPLLSTIATENFIKNKIDLIKKFRDKPEEELPRCTDKELWRGATKYKYYSDPNKISGRSTKNFDDPLLAQQYCAKQGRGIVLTVPGEVKRCLYCRAYDICKQRREYYPDKEKDYV